MTTASSPSELGYRSFWTAETTGPEAFSLLAAAGAAAPALDLGTGVLALQLRTPMVVAMAGATLQALHPDATSCSASASPRRWSPSAGTARPTASARSPGCASTSRCCGPACRARRSTSPATSTRSRASGSACGSASGGPRSWSAPSTRRCCAWPASWPTACCSTTCPPAHVPWSVEQVRDGRRRHGLRLRPRRGAASARTASSWPGATCSPTPWSTATPRNFERAGFGDEVAEVRARFAEGDRAGAVAAVSDRMVDAIDVMGDDDTVARPRCGLRRRRRRRAGAHAAAVGPRPAGLGRAHRSAPRSASPDRPPPDSCLGTRLRARRRPSTCTRGPRPLAPPELAEPGAGRG